jgi:LPS-assembly protein
VMAKTYLDTGWQYSPSLHHTAIANIGARYQPEINKVLNAGYRFTRNQIKQIDLSVQWPLFGGWYAVARYNYSIQDRKLIEGLGGLEYDGGCWVARLVLHRLATQTGSSTSAIFFQLELNGLARIGSNPIEMLKRNIPGYGVINQPTADPIFGAY